MKKVLLSIMLLSMITFTIDAQRTCETMENFQYQLEEDPGLELKIDEIEKFTQKFIKEDQRVNGTIITIPVVVHVVYKTNTQNISNAQIFSQIDVLNDDFRRTNADQDNAWNVGADTEIEFCMASLDPAGNSTNGIERRNTNKPSFNNDNVKKYNKGGLDAWPADDYLNIWVCNLSGSLLGYAQFPGGNDATDGVVIDYAYFGTIGTATSPFDLGRTATHEVGHWLNLRHIWGDGGCSVDDFVSDTPLSDAPNYGCALGHQSCGSLDMVQNYMDYSDDACMNLFTAGQSDRMNALFGGGGARESLLTSNGCGNGGGPTCSDGIMNGDEDGVDCGGSFCDPCGGGPTCSDGIMNGDEDGVDCGGSFCDPCGGGSCDTPSGTVASNIKPKRAKLNWSSVSSATSYNIQIDEAGQTNWNTFSSSSTNITISGLSNGQAYDWRVQSVCGGDVSAWSSTCNFQAGNSSSGDCAARIANVSPSIYPNPAIDIVYISELSEGTASTVEVIDLSGKLISVHEIEQAYEGISVSNLEDGMYLMKINYTNKESKIQKFFVLK